MSEKNRKPEGKTGVFICDCGTNIAGFLDTKRLVEHFSGKENVEAFGSLHLCSESGLQLVKDSIKEHGLERVVVACCTPRLHGELFRRTVEEAGLNPNRLAVANIREQCSWVHWFSREKATGKALDLVDMAVASVGRTVEARKVKIPVERRVLVIGGGVAGITAALNLANMGMEVVLVEKSGFIGGHMAKWDKVFPTLDCSICILGPLMAEVYSHPKVEVYTLCEVSGVKGTAGNYEVELYRKARYVDLEKCNGCNKCLDVCPITVPNEYEYGIGERRAMVKPYAEAVPTAPYIDMENCVGCRSCVAVCDQEAINFEEKDEKFKVKVGAIIVATGFSPIDPAGIGEYGYGRHVDVITGAELERLVNPAGPTKGRLVRLSNGLTPRSIAFIQCVGSRSTRLNRPYCSVVCCNYAVKQAMEIKSLHPEADVAIFYIDVRASGKGYEEAFLKAQATGVRFIRGRVGRVAKAGDRLRIFYEDTLTGETCWEDFDLVVLSVGIAPNSDNEKLSRILKTPLDENGFFMEEHCKLRPADTFMRGIFTAGTAQGPKDITASVSQAGLAASKAYAFLSNPELELEVEAPTVDHDLCVKCGLCVKFCDYGALSRVNGEITVDEVACMGCGACVAVCPTGAISIPFITDGQIEAMIRTLAENARERPLILAFFCRWCGYAAADMAGLNRNPYPTNVRIIQLPCAARVNALHILEAFKQGIDGVLIVGCDENSCHYITGIRKAMERVSRLKKVLEALGVNPERVHLDHAGASEGEKVARVITEFVAKVRRLGPVGAELSKLTVRGG